ncbi:hypothetical protein JHK86_033884 [Glycine max]|nr:hypothetical protein JHK86_033884 [Glycine max]
MPPKYATRGHFSVKSDVFSYGVIVLDIISGKKNMEISNSDNFNNLLGHVQNLNFVPIDCSECSFVIRRMLYQVKCGKSFKRKVEGILESAIGLAALLGFVVCLPPPPFQFYSASLIYARLDIHDGGSGCLLWIHTLDDMRKFSQWGGD